MSSRQLEFKLLRIRSEETGGHLQSDGKLKRKKRRPNPFSKALALNAARIRWQDLPEDGIITDQDGKLVKGQTRRPAYPQARDEKTSRLAQALNRGWEPEKKPPNYGPDRIRTRLRVSPYSITTSFARFAPFPQPGEKTDWKALQRMVEIARQKLKSVKA